MSDSMINDSPAQHPCAVEWDRLRQARPRLFEGQADGRYLSNRLQEAFQEGWMACERAVRQAMEGR
jgi:hypothetical protein